MEPADGTVLPNPAVPKTLGILNVIFAVLLTVLGVCGTAIVVAAPYIQQRAQAAAAQQKEEEEREQAAQLKVLDDRAAAATTDEEKATIASERDALTNRPPNVVINFDMSALPTDPKMITFVLISGIWSLILNVLLMASGIGLIRLRSWGRRACLIWAGVSIATSVGFTAYGLVFNAEASKAATEAQLAKVRAAAKQPNATPGDQLAVQLTETIARYTPVIVLGQVLAQITYPIICLILLNLAAARAACRSRASALDAPGSGGFPFPPAI